MGLIPIGSMIGMAGTVFSNMTLFAGFFFFFTTGVLSMSLSESLELESESESKYKLTRPVFASRSSSSNSALSHPSSKEIEGGDKVLRFAAGIHFLIFAHNVAGIPL